MENIIKIIVDEDNNYLFNSDNIISINLRECRLFEIFDSCEIEITTLKKDYVIKLDERSILNKFKIDFNYKDLKGEPSMTGWDLSRRYKFCGSLQGNQGLYEWISNCGNSAIRSIYGSFSICNNIALDENNNIALDEDWCVTIYEN